MEIFDGSTQLYHPKDVIDFKRKKFQLLWAPKPIDRGDAQETFRKIREDAQFCSLPPLEADMLSQAAKRIKPKAGLGVDRITPVDYQRLPAAALAELTLILQAVEETLVWPIQTMLIVGKLAPKKKLATGP